jgi:hypothetical protein
MQNLVEFGRMEENYYPGSKLVINTSSSTHSKRLHSSNEKLMEIQRIKKLDQLRIELDEFKAIHLQKDLSIDESEKQDIPLGSQSFRGSNLTLVSLNGN